MSYPASKGPPVMYVWNLYLATSIQNADTLRWKQNGSNFVADIFIFIFVHENCCILIEISLNDVSKYPMLNKPPVVSRI